MLYVAVTPSLVWVALIIAALAALVVQRPKGSVIHNLALCLAVGQAAIALVALWATASEAIGGFACLMGYTGSRLLVMLLLGVVGTLVTFLFAAGQATVRLLVASKGFTIAFVILQVVTLGATFRSALLCTV